MVVQARNSCQAPANSASSATAAPTTRGQRRGERWRGRLRRPAGVACATPRQTALSPGGADRTLAGGELGAGERDEDEHHRQPDGELEQQPLDAAARAIDRGVGAERGGEARTA